MTKKELIKALSQYPDDALVKVDVSTITEDFECKDIEFVAPFSVEVEPFSTDTELVHIDLILARDENDI